MGLLSGPPLYLAQQALRVMLADSATFRTLVSAADRAEALESIYLEGLPEPAGDADQHTLAEIQALRPYAVVHTAEQNPVVDELDAIGSGHEFQQGGRVIVRLAQNCPGGLDSAPDSDANRQWKNTVGEILDELCDLVGGDGDYLAIKEIGLAEGPDWLPESQGPTRGSRQQAVLAVEW